MPPAGRIARSRIAANENDENTHTTRLTRAKAASLDSNAAQATKQPLQSKRSAANANPTAGRRRAALGDVSNVGKTDAVEGKKPAAAKISMVSKAAQPTGIQKNVTRSTAARSTSARTVLAAKEIKKTEVKRAGSGAGAIGVASQKRKITSTTTVKADVTVEDSEPVRKRAHTSEDGQKKHARSESATVKPEPIEKESAEPEPLYQPPTQATVRELPEGVVDLDSEDLDDPLMAAEYATEIFEYLRDLECKSMPNPTYINHQDDIGWRTRGILIDWLIEVHTRFHLLPETLFLAINIVDRFLSKKVVQLDRLQLVGVAAMFIACKYEEVVSIHVGNFKMIADNGFEESEILEAERYILGVLDYDLSYPNPMNFLRRISKADNYDIQVRTIGKYLMEVSLLDHRFMAYRPSHVAAAAIYLARLMLERGEWDETIEYYSGYTEAEIEPVFELMVDYLARPVIHEAFYKKYASKKFHKASLITRDWAKRNAHIFGVEDVHLTLDEFAS
ncbi:cyclin-like protein [Nemania sp. NC0429]|nr:cyclin-like protein [Nemania sp. NC0429]